MALIHLQPINSILRNILFPFRKIIPSKFHFAIDGIISVPLTEGKKMRMIANPTSNLHRVLFWYGYKGFEPEEYYIFTHLAKSSTCLFDIGANVGYYSIVARLFNPIIHVHAFEPLPAAKKFFEKNMILNDIEGVVINQIALSDKIGEASFFANLNPRFINIEDHLFGDNSLYKNFHSSEYKQIETKVKTLTLDDYASSNLEGGLNIDLVKLDTEGSENLVLKGAGHVLKYHKPVIMCEVVKDCIEKELETILKSFNYKFFRLENGKLQEVSELLPKSLKEDYFFVEVSKLFRIKKFLYD